VTKTKVFEIFGVQDEYTSLLSSTNQVISDGTIFLSSPIDPLFLILPHLMRESVHISSEGHARYRLIFPTQVFPRNIQRLLQIPKTNLENIADINEAFDDVCAAYNPDKCKNWLKKKIERLKEALPQDNSRTSTRLKDALSILGEYLPPNLFAAFVKENYDVKLETVYKNNLSKKRKLSTPPGKLDFSRSKESFSFKKAKRPPARKKQKVKPHGMKSLANYFKKKTG